MFRAKANIPPELLRGRHDPGRRAWRIANEFKLVEEYFDIVLHMSASTAVGRTEIFVPRRGGRRARRIGEAVSATVAKS